MYDVIERKTNCKENLPASSNAAKHKYVGQPLLKCSSFASIFFINKYFFSFYMGQDIMTFVLIFQGPVVQNFVSLVSSLRPQLV